MVGSKYSGNHLVSEKYKTVRSFQLYILQYSPLVQLYLVASDWKDDGNIPGRYSVKENLSSCSVAFQTMSVAHKSAVSFV